MLAARRSGPRRLVYVSLCRSAPNHLCSYQSACRWGRHRQEYVHPAAQQRCGPTFPNSCVTFL